MSHKELHYLEQIRQLGFRVTPQRQFILDTLCEHGHHATAADLYTKVRAKMPAINLATIYRTLDFFCELRIVSKNQMAGETVYEIVGATPHHHLVCRGCNHVAVLDAHHFESLSRHLWEEHQFVPDLDHLVINGLCADCYGM